MSNNKRSSTTAVTIAVLLQTAFLFTVGAFALPPAEAFELITPEEAALPSGTLASLTLRGSPTRRPNVTVVSPPAHAGVMHSPIDLKLQFRAFGGATIDPASVIVTYLKEPAVDLTQRLAPFITPDGITLAQAEVPPGKHQLWIELKDNEGRVGGTAFTFQVMK